ncbi:hypothetical protein ACFE04_015571 [Oxalis oulophora]
MGLVGIREVWNSNFIPQIMSLSSFLPKYPVVAIDTEFPGFILKCDKDAPESTRYSMMKHNVDNTKLIQLGITLSDHYGNIAGSWEFNFRDFDSSSDLCDPTSITFLKKNGMDLDKINELGISLDCFRRTFADLLSRQRLHMKWVVFHGLYDFAYLLRLMTGLSRTELGLEKLAKIVKVKRLGGAHHAGSDSLLTASVFLKMKELFQIQDNDYGGFLYGLSFRATIRIYPKPVFVQHPPIPVPLFVRRPIIRSLYRPICAPVFIPVTTVPRNFYIA